MRVMTQNILFGGEARFEALCQVLAAARPDVLCLQECLAWEDGLRLPQLAQAPRPAQPTTRTSICRPRNPRGSGRRFHLALLSRLPILTARSHTAGSGHSLHCKSRSRCPTTTRSPPPRARRKPSPSSAPTRRRQRRSPPGRDRRAARPSGPLHLHRGDPVVLLGDLNALSPPTPTRLISTPASPASASPNTARPRFDVMPPPTAAPSSTH